MLAPTLTLGGLFLGLWTRVPRLLPTLQSGPSLPWAAPMGRLTGGRVTPLQPPLRWQVVGEAASGV